jgi:macrolide transport system ATP-binding/permease protein
MSLLRRISNLFSRSKVEREIEKELAAHIEMRIEDNRAAGMSAQEARRDALLRFGNRSIMQERTTETDTALYLASIWADTRYALRQLRKNPGFTATAVLMIALGMGASVAIFAFVNAALIQPLPYRDPARLVSVYETVASCPLCNISYQNWRDWKKSETAFSALEAWGYMRYSLRSQNGAESAMGARVSDGFFRALGVAPVLGRDFYAGEDSPGAARTVLISYTSWQKRFAGNPNVVGQSITLSDIPYTIVGVLPRGFHFAPRGEAEFWAPLNEASSCDLRRACHGLFGLARLKDGVSVANAAAEMQTLAGQLGKQYPESNHGYGATAVPLSESIVGNIRPLLLVLLGGAGLLLLIACVNVVSLLLVRSESRRQEIAVRGALGASRMRLMRQFATEGLVLVAVGSALGFGGASLAMQLLLKLIPADRMDGMPYLLELGFHPRVMAFSGLIALGAAAIFGLAPGLRMAFPSKAANMRADLAEGGRGSAGKAWSRLGSRLVMAELAMAMVLLVGAGLLGKSLYRLLNVDLGFQPDHLATLVVTMPNSYDTDAQVMALEGQIESRVSRLPGVKSTGISTYLPVEYWGGDVSIVAPGHVKLSERNDLPERDVSAGYLKMLGARLLRGRYFTEAEDDPAVPRVVVINESLAEKFFPGENPIGKRLAYEHAKDTMEIVGVVEDIKEGQLDTTNRATIYVPFTQGWYRAFNVMVRTRQTPEAMLVSLAAAVHEIDPLIVTSEAKTMNEAIHDSNSAYLHRSSAWLVGGFAALALVLAVVGLYGVIAYSVAQRTREIGVRIALGAQRTTVYGLILKEAGGLTAIGIAAGLVCSVAAATLIRSLLFGTQAWDAGTLGAVAAVLALSALLASYIPARRAASVNPVEALRSE